MSVETHIKSLSKKHEELEEQIHYAHVKHLPTTELKREKLKIKDEINRFLIAANQNNA